MVGEMGGGENYNSSPMEKCGVVQHENKLYDRKTLVKNLVNGVEAVSGKKMIHPGTYPGTTAEYYLFFHFDRLMSRVKQMDEWNTIDTKVKGQKTRQFTAKMSEFVLLELMKEFETNAMEYSRNDAAGNLWRSGLTPSIIREVFHYMYPDAGLLESKDI